MLKPMYEFFMVSRQSETPKPLKELRYKNLSAEAVLYITNQLLDFYNSHEKHGTRRKNNMKVILAPTYDIAKDITADATVEAEYGSACVEGKFATLAHHGPRSGNPAPCNTENVPVLEEDSTILVSHIDLDTLGGILALMGTKPDDMGFWAGAEIIDVTGPHHIHELPEPVQDKLNAYYAWSETQGRERYTELTDVTDKVTAAAQAVDIICNDRHPEHDEYIRNGKNWVKETTQAVEKCLTQETEYARGFVTDGSTFCLGNYYSPNDSKIHPATVQYHGKTKAITIAFADWKEHGLKANDIVQELWGPEAGGREGIAGSPRGQEMSLDDYKNAFNTINSLLREKELAGKEIPAFANDIISVGPNIEDLNLDIENTHLPTSQDLRDNVDAFSRVMQEGDTCWLNTPGSAENRRLMVEKKNGLLYIGEYDINTKLGSREILQVDALELSKAQFGQTVTVNGVPCIYMGGRTGRELMTIGNTGENTFGEIQNTLDNFNNSHGIATLNGSSISFFDISQNFENEPENSEKLLVEHTQKIGTFQDLQIGDD